MTTPGTGPRVGSIPSTSTGPPLDAASRSETRADRGLPARDPAPALMATVLVCDDDASVRVLLERILERAGYRSVTADAGDVAMRLLATERVDAIIADQQLRTMTGIDLHRHVTQHHPGLASRFVLITGDPDDTSVLAFAGRWQVPVLAKPFNVSQVALTLEQMLGF